MKVLITGASGFVGQAVAKALSLNGHEIVRTVRRKQSDSLVVGDIGPKTNWQEALKKCGVVIHLAARVHVMNEKSSDPMTEFRRVNVEGTTALARQAAAAGVKRFIFLSSIKVNGEHSESGQPFTANDAPRPEDPYGISKYEAEKILQAIAAETAMEVVIIRPPLVYGPGVKANFESMMHWLSRGLPLPLSAITENRRSLVAIDNLVDLVMTCLDSPNAANQTFLVSDGEDLSTAQLLERMGVEMGKPARLFYLPSALLKLGSILLNQPSTYQRLCGSLQLDITKTRQLLGWTPLVTVQEGLRRAAEGYRP
jgi:nucleoside-diphosphate-sugar epimerase